MENKENAKVEIKDNRGVKLVRTTLTDGADWMYHEAQNTDSEAFGWITLQDNGLYLVEMVGEVFLGFDFDSRESAEADLIAEANVYVTAKQYRMMTYRR